MDARDLINIIDYKVWFATFSTAIISAANISVALTALASMVTIGYTVHKWYLLWKSKK